MQSPISGLILVPICIVNLLMLINCDPPEPSLLADGVRANAIEARRFDLTVVSKNAWRVADRSIEGGETEAFFTRRETPSSGALLIRSQFTGTVFLYDLASRQLEVSTPEKWESSTDDVAHCAGPSAGLGDLDGQPERKAVLWKTKKDLPIQVTVDISGRHQWGDMLLSPTRRKLAVFSFDGPYKPQNFLFGTAQTIKGSRYIDFFEVVKEPMSGSPNESSRPEVRPFGVPVVMNDPTESVSLYPCWTPDEQLIVILDISSPWLWIVEVRS